MPSTLVHSILPTSCVLYSHSKFPKLTKRETIKLAFASVVIGNMPDLDIIPAFFSTNNAFEIHRNWGHNIFSVVLWTILGVLALRHLVCRRFSLRTAIVLSASLVLSHICLDAMGSASNDWGRRVGVPLLFPFSKWEFLLPVHLYQTYPLAKGVNPIVGIIVAPSYWHSAIFSEFFSTAALFLLWVLVFSVVNVIAKTIRRPHQDRMQPFPNEKKTSAA